MTQIAALAAKAKLPALAGVTGFAEAGVLLSYGPNFTDLTRRSTTYVHKILKGAKPADLPIEQPTNFELEINAKTAKALGLTIRRRCWFAQTRSSGRVSPGSTPNSLRSS
jgi:putative ABC transport system substrate-binding protein